MTKSELTQSSSCESNSMLITARAVKLSGISTVQLGDHEGDVVGICGVAGSNNGLCDGSEEDNTIGGVVGVSMGASVGGSVGGSVVACLSVGNLSFGIKKPQNLIYSIYSSSLRCLFVVDEGAKMTAIVAITSIIDIAAKVLLALLLLIDSPFNT